MMLLSRAILCLLGLASSTLFFADPAAASRQSDDIFQAQGLVGSHFGQVGIPASYNGGGTAGLTVARRLAECHSVAVIEAGGLYELDNRNFTQSLLLHPTTWERTQLSTIHSWSGDNKRRPRQALMEPRCIIFRGEPSAEVVAAI